jgi:uncharacterized protein YegL
MTRRLPVYLLLDCSESMIGPGIEGLRTAVGTMLKELRSNPHALESVWISFITMDSDARQITPLTPLDQAQPPSLHVRPGTALGAALRVTADAIRREVKRTSSTIKGDYRPLVFLITDGQATDDWQNAIGALQANGGTRPANVYAIGCGSDVDYAQLGKVTDIVLKLDQIGPEGFSKLFVWLSASINSASVGLSESSPDSMLENLPKEVSRVDLKKAPTHDGKNRQIFLRANCSAKRGAYLMRYRLDERTELYAAVTSHPLERTTEPQKAQFRLPPVNSDVLMGCPSCPYCENDAAGKCGNCGALFCLPSEGRQVSVTCPCCETSLDLGESQGGFDINQSTG